MADIKSLSGIRQSAAPEHFTPPCSSCYIPFGLEFVFYILDEESREGIHGVKFELTDEYGSKATCQSDANGAVRLNLWSGTCYRLMEISCPAGYELHREPFDIIVNYRGGILVNNRLVTRFELISRLSD